MTRQQAHELVTYLVAVYRPGKWGEVDQRVYVDAIIDLDYEQTTAAVRVMARTDAREFMPRPAEIRRALTPETVGVEEAWREVLDAARQYGRLSQPEWSSPLIAATVRTVGWSDICGSEFLAVEHKAFVSAYESHRERAVREQASVPAVGRQVLELGD